jgi:hypothetical protein
MKIRNQKDFWSGVMFFAFGLFFAIGAQNYPFGSAQRMGPAYFPTVLGALLAAMGIFIAVKGLGSKVRDDVEPFHWRPLLLVLGAVLLFALLLRPLGLVLSILLLIFVGALGGPDFKSKEVIVVAVAMIALVLVVFIWGLALTVPVWPAFISN